MRELVLGISENLHVRAEHKNVLRLPTTDDPAAEQQPAQVLGERRRSAELPSVP
jgi:hypothetical protein